MYIMIIKGVSMLKQERWMKIAQLCQQKDRVTVEELVETLHVSPATIRRDLQQMEDESLIVRYHGGAKSKENLLEEPSMIIKNVSNVDQKRHIACYAASLIRDNQMIYIDAGSTTLMMLQYITAKNITVVTPGVPHLTLLGERGISTIVLGGTLRWSTQAITGRQAVRQLSEMYFDECFVGTNGIHSQVGFTTSNEMEAETKALAIHHAKKAYVLADHSKFNILCPVHFADLKEAMIICDTVEDFDTSLIDYACVCGQQGA